MIVSKNYFISLFLRMLQKKLEADLPETDFECDMLEQAWNITKEA